MTTIVKPPAGLGIHDGPTELPSDASIIGGKLRYVHEYEMPDGRVAKVGIGVGLDGPTDAEESRTAHMLKVYPPSLTESLEKDIKRLTERFEEITGYDREGKPQYRVTGTERHRLETSLALKRQALPQAWADRRQAEAMQEASRVAEAKRHQRIEAAAAEKAEQIAEEAEIQRLAEQIARRKHGTNGRG